MSELEKLGREVREQLGEPPASWLRARRGELRRALATPPAERLTGSRWKLVATLASAVALATLALFFTFGAGVEGPAGRETVLDAPAGAKRLELDDGSALTLDPRSLARVDSGRDGTRCVVELGTVVFDVAPQRKRRFTVVAGAFEIHVVGTRFSVSRDSASAIEVRVEHGVVRVHAAPGTAPVELRSGDHLRGDADGAEVRLTRSALQKGPHGESLPVGGPAPSPSTSVDTTPTPSTSVDTAPTPSASAASPIGDAPTPKQSVAPPEDWQALYRQRKYAQALTAAKQVGETRLLDGLGARALSDLADAARLAGDAAFALRTFSAIERRFPGSPQALDAVFLSGRLYAGMGQPDAALTRFEKYLALNPHGGYSLEATGRLVELYAGRGDPRAKATAKTYLTRAPNGPYQRLCRSVLAAP